MGPLTRYLWGRRRYRSDAPAIVIGGCGRSGTTLLRVILDSHPNICCGPESRLFVDRDLDEERVLELAELFNLPTEIVADIQRGSRSHAEFIDRFLLETCKTAGKTRWAEKTPKNVRAVPYIFDHFPQATFVHVIRDGRDVVRSLRTHPRFRSIAGKWVETGIRTPVEKCIKRWREDVGGGIAWRGDPRYVEIRYEDLVLRSEDTLRGLLDRLGEQWDARVLRFHEVSTPSRDPRRFPQNREATRPLSERSVGRWRSDLTAEEAVVFKRMAGQLLIDLGYVENDAWEPTGQSK